jgi:hypothetical protein
MVKKFSEFLLERRLVRDNDFNPSYYYQRDEKKTKFSNWLDNLSHKIRNDRASSRSEFDFGGMSSLGAIAGILASVFDALFAKRFVGKKYQKMSDEEIDQWERSLGEKSYKEKDVAKFYESGVLKGKKKFGNKFNYEDPNSEDEKEYMSDLRKTTEKLYKKTK